MIEGIDGALQLKSLFKLANFDYLYISGRALNDSKSQPLVRQEIEAMLQLADAKHCEVCSEGVDTPAMLEHATSLGVDIGFGRACGKSVPFPMV
jgi:EAL domain-containing protein (putative c-di-GMP-specific phosphodiesterase class I)